MMGGRAVWFSPAVNPEQNWWDGLLESWFGLPLGLQATLGALLLVLGFALVASLALWGVGVAGMRTKRFPDDLAAPPSAARKRWWTVAGRSWTALPGWAKATHSSLLLSLLVLGVTSVIPRSAELGMTPTELDFGAVATGGEVIDSIRVTNLGKPGSASIEITSWAITGPAAGLFRMLDDGQLIAGPGTPANLRVAFTPDGVGIMAATLMVEHTGTNSPLNITLSGRGANLLRVNAGGRDIAGSPDWPNDATFVSSPDSHSHEDTTVTVTMGHPSLPIETPQGLFLSQRFANRSQLVYEFPVESGRYEVRLYFADVESTGRGQRIFDILVNDEPVLSGYDIFADVGRATATMKPFTVETTGRLTVALREVEGNPAISALEIVDISQTAASELLSSSLLIDVGPVVVTTTGSAEVQLTSKSDPLVDPVITLGEMNIEGADAFSIVDQGATVLGQGRSLTVTIIFAPQDLGPDDAVLIVDHTGSASPLGLDLTGFGWAANDDEATTQEDTPVSVPVLANDGDPSGEVLTIALVGKPNSGSAAIVDSSITYRPTTNFNGADAFTYTVSDGVGGVREANVNVTVTKVNDPPTARPGGPYSGTVDIAVNFNGSGSTDPDGSIVSYLWTFGDGATSTLPNPTHTYTKPGNYPVTLKVTDNAAATHTATTTAKIKKK